MATQLYEDLWDRHDRVPNDGLLALWEIEVEEIMRNTYRQPSPWPWQPPSSCRMMLFGRDAIIIDRPPLPVPP